MPLNHDQVENILCSALQIPKEKERQEFVERECGPNIELKREIDKLINSHLNAGSFLESPTATSSAGDTLPECDNAKHLIGKTIGSYRLERLIGIGGMGAVYFAEQLSPIQRAVAIKVLRRGLSTAGIRARFEHERHSLGLMDHPNIARVYDAGSTSDGDPYIAMEWVEGDYITSFCDQEKYSIQSRVELVIATCKAVQHAHQKGIIHRDLKPANVLVTKKDGQAVPKVIDFGVSRATDSFSLAREPMTEIGQIIGTFEYMAPEQADSMNLDVDTRADVYALGALLYELLTGSPPIPTESFRSVGFAERLRLIREVEPIRPSDRCRRSHNAKEIAFNRQTGTTQLRRMISNELDWITLKCLEKDRGRRYETANAMAQDLQRFLDRQSVLAGPPTIAYRFKRFASRNRGLLAIASALLLLLFCAAGIGIWQAVRLGRLHQQSESNLKAANHNLDLAISAVDRFCTHVSEDLRLKEQDLRPLRKELLSTAVDFQKQLVDLRQRSGAARVDLAEAHFRLGQLSKEIESNDAAVQSFRHAIDEYELLIRHESNLHLPSYQLKLAMCFRGLSESLFRSGHHSDSIVALAKAVDILDRLSVDDQSIRVRIDIAETRLQQSFFAESVGQYDNAESFAKTAIDEWKNLDLEKPNDAYILSHLSNAYYRYGRIIRKQKMSRWRESEAAFEKGLERSRLGASIEAATTACTVEVSIILSELGDICTATGRDEKAIEYLSESIAKLEQLRRKEHSVLSHANVLANAHVKMARTAKYKDDFERKQFHLNSAIEQWQFVLSVAPLELIPRANLVDALSRLSRVYRQQDDLNQSSNYLDRAVDLLEQGLQIAPTYQALLDKVPDVYEDRAMLNTKRGRLDVAIADYDRAITASPPTVFRTRKILSKADVHLLAGNHQMAIEVEKIAEADIPLNLPSHVQAATLGLCAKICARCAAAAKLDSNLTDERKAKLFEERALMAVGLMRQACEIGLEDKKAAYVMPEFDSIRDREDFRAIFERE